MHFATLATMIAFIATAPFAADANHSVSPGRIAAPIAPRNLQILLEKEASEVLLEVKGPYQLFNPHDGSRLISGLFGKRFIIRETDNGLRWGEAFPGVHQLYIQPKSPKTSILVNGIQYAGAIAIYGINGTIHVVNDIDIETYVKSVLSVRFPVPLEPEVMSALAIITRTHAYYHAIKNPDSFWHTDKEADRYSGNALIVAGSPWERAIETTRNLILVRTVDGERRMPIPALWTEHSAGKTACYDTMLRIETDTAAKGVEAPHALIARQDSKWSFSMAKKRFAQLFDLGEVQAIETFLDPSSGKVYGVRIKDKNESQNIDFLTLQEKCGADRLLSSDFCVSLGQDTILFTGYGKGLGVGLCLYSASALAQNGDDAVKILSKFFPEASLHNIDALPVR